MKKGIILEIHKDFLTLLTPDGEFLRAKREHNHYQIGQEIDFLPVAAADRKKPFFVNLIASFKGKAVAAAIVAILFSSILFFPFYQNGQVYAYMSIDINPSLELGVNEHLQVVELTSFNKEGQAIIEEIDDWKKEDLSIVTEKILAKIKEKGYIKQQNDLVISTVYTGKREKSPDREISKELNKIESDLQKQDLEVTIVEGTAEEREKAIKQGVTTGTYKKQQEAKFETSSIEEKERPVSKQRTAISNKKQLDSKQRNNSADSKKETLNNAPPRLLKIEDKREQRELKEKNRYLHKEVKLPPKQQKKQDNDHKEHHEKRDRNQHNGNSEKKLKEKIEKQPPRVNKNKSEEKKNNSSEKNQRKKGDNQEKEKSGK